jgi:hypothetical protein
VDKSIHLVWRITRDLKRREDDEALNKSNAWEQPVRTTCIEQNTER